MQTKQYLLPVFPFLSFCEMYQLMPEKEPEKTIL